MSKFKSPRGTYDLLPEESRKWQWVLDHSRSIMRRYGYREIQTPLIEEAGLFLRGVGEATDIATKEMYIFNDRRGRELALRPEGTAPVVRSYIQHHLQTDREVQKLYYFGQMFRYDRPQAGRNRQFFQIGSEAIGSGSPLLDLETILLCREIFSRIGLKDTTIVINSVGCRVCRPGYQDSIREALTDRLDSLCPDCQERYRKNPLRILDCKVAECRRHHGDIPVITEYLCEECSDHHTRVRDGLQRTGSEFREDPRLVRGLDYYTRTAFEVVHGKLGDQLSIGGGGRYDDLVSILGGGDVPAVGFSAGLERMLLALESQDAEWGREKNEEGFLDLFLIYTDDRTRDEAVYRMAGLRRSFAVDIDYMGKSVKGQFRMANRLGVRYVAVVGSDELDRGCVLLRDMEGGEEREVPIDSLETTLKEEREREYGER